MTVTDDAIEAYRTPCRPRRRCSLCAGRDLREVVSLTPTPPAAALVRAGGLGIREPCFPLDLGRCADCGHVQLLHVVNRLKVVGLPADGDGSRPEVVRHLDGYARDLMRRFPAPAEPFVIDIGANDGTFLALFEDAGWRVQGVEASANVAGAAIARGIPTHPNLFSLALAERIEEERGHAHLVTLHQCLAEAEDPVDLMDGVRIMLARDGLVAFEVRYLGDIVGNGRIDAITHADLDYYGARSLKRFLASCDLDLIRVEHSGFRGGTLRGLAQRAGGGLPPDGSVERLIEQEQRRGLDDPATLARFADAVAQAKKALASQVEALRAEGLRLAGWGADPGTTTLLYHFDLGPDVLEFIVDESEHRQSRFTPGLHIPILPPAALAERRPDAVVLLSGAGEEARSQLSAFRAAGGRVLEPLATAL